MLPRPYCNPQSFAFVMYTSVACTSMIYNTWTEIFKDKKKKLDALACNSALKNNMLCKNTAYNAVHAAVSGCLICRVVDI